MATLCGVAFRHSLARHGHQYLSLKKLHVNSASSCEKNTQALRPLLHAPRGTATGRATGCVWKDAKKARAGIWRRVYPSMLSTNGTNACEMVRAGAALFLASP